MEIREIAEIDCRTELIQEILLKELKEKHIVQKKYKKGFQILLFEQINGE